MLLVVPGLPGTPLDVRRADPDPGTELTAAGFPGGVFAVNHGPVTDNAANLHVDLELGQGASGGPAFDADGRLAGILSFAGTHGAAVESVFVGPAVITGFLARARAEPRPRRQ